MNKIMEWIITNKTSSNYTFRLHGTNIFVSISKLYPSGDFNIESYNRAELGSFIIEIIGQHIESEAEALFLATDYMNKFMEKKQ